MKYKVKELSSLAKVSVRTLHHYDEIDLLKPEYISDAGYRLYSENDIERLQQILFFKELDFSLKEIKEILDNPHFNKIYALNGQKELLIEKKNRLEKIIEAIDKSIVLAKGGLKMSKEEIFSTFNMDEVNKIKEKYAKEAKEKFGNSEAYKQSEEKGAKYNENDWKNIMADAQKIFGEIASMMDKSPSDDAVQSLVDKWRQYISKNFYNCTIEIFRGLGQMYIYDERFTKNIDKTKDGLAKFLSKAIEIYCNNNK
ncbi:DNA-binding transcriptional regulator, MerR family [Clostridium cavendishii DSM 21758]|uniref:DNA-binding transcriptional regulator, MerR family n=1 Tax=Clostridium cavendishii DSM 21758 TaxID=1121302 RepID=A0A1M6FAJ4_9CLOT|nr:MerR family transcriptional regulator [Clostridium cavendishii]SHI94629.1 DNA-binding transcriptional regulator, MerR family [Clostridium cavendishii DSM 21758]